MILFDCVSVFLPPSALEHLTRLNVVYPMLFKLTNVPDSRSTHCGVLEFVADEGKIYIPYWVKIVYELRQNNLMLVIYLYFVMITCLVWFCR